MCIIFDGKTFASQKEKVLQSRIIEITKKLNRKPKLVAVGISAEKDVAMYISMKEKVAAKIGVEVERKVFREDSEEPEVCEFVKERNKDKTVDGILLELPIPKKFSVTKIMEQVSPEKDPDCMTYENLGRFLFGKPRYFPATVRAIKDIVDEASKIEGLKSKIQNKPLAYKNAVVIGGGIEVGKPLAMWLSDLGAAVSLCRSTTHDLSEFTKNADIIISAAGVPNIVKGEMVKQGVIVIDAGINFVNGKTAGDVEFVSVSKKATFITPVPGGVGPVTIISLFENLCQI